MSKKSDRDTVIVRDRVYIPIHMVNTNELKELYTTKLYEDKACATCDHYQDRHSYLCDTCEAYKGAVKLFKNKTVGGLSYIGLPVGDKRNFERKTGLLNSETKFKDLRTRAPFTVKFKFLTPLRDYQVPVIEDFLKHKFGLIEAPPRTGKTLMMLYIATQLGQRAVLLANQHEFLTQFIDHIQGNEAEGIPKCTNLPELEKKHKKKLFGFPKTDEDFKNFQFFVMTYQQFISEKNGLNRFKRLAPHVGTLMIDECFTYGHLLQTDKGLIPIGDVVEEKVKISKVLSFNHDTGKSEMRKIESFTKKRTKKICRVTVGGEQYMCTPNHEFYVENRGYVKASDLREGDNVLDL